MITGLISAKACAIMAGLGMRLRKKMWHPQQNSKINSKAIPYMCAIGRMLIMGSPLFTWAPKTLMAKSKLPQSAR